MNRRNFLKILAGGAAGFALDPERLLWVPGQRTHFVMPSIAFDHVEYSGSFTVSTNDVIEIFKQVYGSERLAELARQEIVLWNVLSKRA